MKSFLILTGNYILFLGAIFAIQSRSEVWLFSKPGWLDEWIYINYFIDLSNQNSWNGYYKASRIPYNAIGNLGFKIIGFEKYLELQHWIYLTLFLTLIFFLIRKYKKLNYALFISFLVTLNPEFHGSGGWLYQNTLSILLLIFAYALIVSMIQNDYWAKKDKKNISYLLILCISIIATHLLIVNTLNTLALIPLVFILILMAKKNEIFEIIAKLIIILIGFFGTLTFWSAYSNLMGFRLRFWQPLLETFINYSSGSHEVWHKGFFDLWWLNTNYSYVSSICVATFFSLFFLIKKQRGRVLNLDDFFERLKSDLVFFLSFVTFIVNMTWVISYIFRLHILEYDYHALPAILFSSLFLIVLITTYLQKVIENNFGLDSNIEKFLPFSGLIISFYALVNIDFINLIVRYFTKNTLMILISLVLVTIILKIFSAIKKSHNNFLLSTSILLLSFLVIFIELNVINSRASSKYNSSLCKSTREATFSVVQWVIATRSYDSIYVFFDSQDLLYKGTACAYSIENLGNSLVETGNFKLNFPMGNNPGFSEGLKSEEKFIGILTSNNYDESNLSVELNTNSYVLLEKLPVVDVDSDGMFPTLNIYSRVNS